MKVQVELYGGLIKDVESFYIEHGMGSVDVSKETLKKILLKKEKTFKKRFVFTQPQLIALI